MTDAVAVALDLRDHVAFDRSTPVVLPVAASGELGLAVVCLEPGQALDARLADGDLLLTVVGGRAWVLVDDAEVVLEPLQAVLVPRGAAYGVRNDSPDPLILQRVAGPSAGDGDATTAVPVAAPAGEGPAAPGAAPDDLPTQEPSEPRRLDRLRRLLGSG